MGKAVETTAYIGVKGSPPIQRHTHTHLIVDNPNSNITHREEFIVGEGVGGSTLGAITSS